MPIDRATRARGRLALYEASRRHLYDGNVTSIDFGLPSRGGRRIRGKPAIRFHVAKKLSGLALERAVGAHETAPLPSSVGEFETDVIEGRYRPHWWMWRPTMSSPRLRRHNPLRGGISVSREGQYGPGTLAGVVLDRTTGDPMLLSNWHVFVADWWTRPGVAVYQPGRRDGGTFQDLVARYTRDAMGANLDAAVAAAADSRRLSNEQLELGPVQGLAEPEPGMQVVKSGRQTGITYGEVTGVDGTAKLRYGFLDRVIRRVVTIEPIAGAGEVSDGGDSGSLWLDAASRACVALHFAGSNVPERALGMEIGPVLDALGVDLA
jgi:endonuclease G, mitochondrial